MEGSTASTIALVAVIGILVFFLIFGFRKGFLRLVLTTLAFIVTVVLAGALTPVCSHFIRDSFIGKSVTQEIDKFVKDSITSQVTETSKDLQEKVIEQLPLPEVVQKELLKNNTAEGYFEIKAKGFSGYLSTKLSDLGINIITYLLLMIVIYLVIRIVLRILQVLNSIPVIGGINRLLGAIIGLAEGLLLIWVVCLIIMALSGTDFGKQALEVINGNEVLKFIYNHNGIIIGANQLFHTFL